MDDLRSHTSSKSDSHDLFETPPRETPGDKIKSVLSLQAEPAFTVTLEILTVTAAVVIVLLIVVFYMGFLRGRDVERRDVERKIMALKSRQVEGIQVQAARSQFAPYAATTTRPAGVRPAAPSAAVATVAARPVAPRTLPAPVTTVPTARPAAPSPVPAKPIANSVRKPYTVQVVTYRSQPRAQSEVAQLTQKGYAARMVVQGTLYVVCVGEYASRSEGQKDLRALKRIYPDSYLRKF